MTLEICPHSNTSEQNTSGTNKQLEGHLSATGVFVKASMICCSISHTLARQDSLIWLLPQPDRELGREHQAFDYGGTLVIGQREIKAVE